MAVNGVGMSMSVVVLDEQRRRHRDPSRVPLLRRFYDAIVASKRVRAEQEVARYLLTHRDKLTDSLEREIERRFQRG